MKRCWGREGFGFGVGGVGAAGGDERGEGIGNGSFVRGGVGLGLGLTGAEGGQLVALLFFIVIVAGRERREALMLAPDHVTSLEPLSRRKFLTKFSERGSSIMRLTWAARFWLNSSAVAASWSSSSSGIVDQRK